MYVTTDCRIIHVITLNITLENTRWEIVELVPGVPILVWDDLSVNVWYLQTCAEK